MGQAVLLAGVARTTGGDHVLPRVGATLAAGDHVVEVLGRGTAVLAPATVPGEDRTAVHRHAVVVGHLDVADEADDGRLRDTHPLRPEHPLGGVDELRLGVEHQEDGPSAGDDAQRLEGGVEHQGPAVGDIGDRTGGPRPAGVEGAPPPHRSGSGDPSVRAYPCPPGRGGAEADVSRHHSRNETTSARSGTASARP